MDGRICKSEGFHLIAIEELIRASRMARSPLPAADDDKLVI